MTYNAKPPLTGGRWVTTDEGHHIYIKGGKIVAGNPHVVAKLKDAEPPKGSTDTKAKKSVEDHSKSEGHHTDDKGKAVSHTQPKLDHVKDSEHTKGEESKKLPEPAGDAPDHLKEHSQKTIEKWTSDERKAVSRYTNNDYFELNDAMRKCPPAYECVQGDTKKFMDLVEGALQKAPPLAQPVVVTRGMILIGKDTKTKFLDEIRKAKDSGGEYRLPSVTSTTVKGDIAFSGTGESSVKFLIRARTGVYIESVSTKPEEKELLKSSKSRYVVKDVISEPGKAHVVVLDEVL
jgi:hypothetical protein